MSSNDGRQCKCGQVFSNIGEIRRHVLAEGRKEKGKHGFAGRIELTDPLSTQLVEALEQTAQAATTTAKAIKPKQRPVDNKPNIKKILPFTPWKLVLGLVLIGTISGPAGAVYFADVKNMLAAVIMIFSFAPGAWLIYWSLQLKTTGFLFRSERKPTGRENVVILFARKGEDGQDIPVGLHFVELKNPPRGARLHYFRNYKKHFYELFNNTATKKLEPVVMPDKKAFPPELFQVPAAMQAYKDAIDFSPPSLFEKIAPGILLLAMGIIGILMVMTTTSQGG